MPDQPNEIGMLLFRGLEQAEWVWYVLYLWVGTVLIFLVITCSFPQESRLRDIINTQLYIMTLPRILQNRYSPNHFLYLASHLLFPSCVPSSLQISLSCSCSKQQHFRAKQLVTLRRTLKLHESSQVRSSYSYNMFHPLDVWSLKITYL